jgi:phosphatidate cytidylyltransferase
VTLSRVLTAAVLIPAVAAIVWFAPTLIVAVAAALVMLLALFEFFVIADQAGMRGYRGWTGLCALAIFYAQFVASTEKTLPIGGRTEEIVRVSPVAAILSLEHILLFFILGVTAIVIFSRSPVEESLAAISVSSAGLLFVALPLSSIVRIHGVLDGRKLLLFTLVLVWAGDTLAYFVGRSIGKLPMAPHLSPKKTWEGAVANLAGSVLTALVFSRWIDVPPPTLLLIAAAANVAGQAGDLLESAYKRSANMKDSGSILPGHGGMLDRVDALILAAPVVWYYFEWLHAR